MKFLLLPLLLFTCCLYCQEKTPNMEEAEAFFQSGNADIEAMVYYENDELFDMYAKRFPGDIIIMGSDLYKIQGIKYVKVQNCSILSVKTSNLTPAQHKALQKKILAEYKAGTPFAKLISLYGEDEKSGVVDYYLAEGTNFDEAITTHKSGELFTVEVPEPQGFYVMLLNGPRVSKKAVEVLHTVYK